ncbi:MAG: S41 family peptidase, partial [Anaerolineae bacterium]|nr:S41 family peptidase [Anaerolineae bacterium]
SELFDVFEQMLTPLGDGHVSISTDSDSFSPNTLPDWLEGADAVTFMNYMMLPANYYLIDEPKLTANDLMIYGRLSKTVGYISILGFSGFSDSGDDIAVIRQGMTDIRNAFAGVESIVIDIRFNGGGDDASAMYIAGHFTDEPQLVMHKSVWSNQDFQPLMDVYVEPATDHPFTGSVYLLTSRLTASAAETFAIAMHALPNVTLVGEPTNGILSDMWFVVLPNGWLATLSNERYLAANGVLFEGVGIPPDVEVAMNARDFANNTDPVIEAALDIAQS